MLELDAAPGATVVDVIVLSPSAPALAALDGVFSVGTPTSVTTVSVEAPLKGAPLHVVSLPAAVNVSGEQKLRLIAPARHPASVTSFRARSAPER